MKNIELIEIASELGAGTRGASLGVEAIKIAALDYMSDFFLQFPATKIETSNDPLYAAVTTPNAKRIEGIEKLYKKISSAVKECYDKKNFPVVLSGDHSSAGAVIAGIKMAKPKSRLGIIWIDAHADLHTPYTSPTGNVHGMPLAAAIGEDNKTMSNRKLDEITKASWESMKNLGGITPKLFPEDIVFISLRDYEKEEKALIEQYGMKVITTAQVRKIGAEQVSKRALRYLQDCTDIFVSFDVDSLDSGISKGTGTPVSNGLKEREVEDLISKFMHNRKVCCFEITEVNPTLDKENLMAEIAFNILQRSVNILKMN